MRMLYPTRKDPKAFVDHGPGPVGHRSYGTRIGANTMGSFIVSDPRLLRGIMAVGPTEGKGWQSMALQKKAAAGIVPAASASSPRTKHSTDDTAKASSTDPGPSDTP